ncbi:hypothetical protein LTSEMON_0145, partial [Salmonella enterica subsp. enterica serovar Montevideo str. S5-403]
MDKRVRVYHRDQSFKGVIAHGCTSVFLPDGGV